MSKSNSTKILLIVTGSIACYKAADLTSKLRNLGYQIKVVLSEGATQFITPLTFEALSGNKVHTSIWDKDESLAHIDLVRWADLVLVAPATAEFISRLAQGRTNTLPLALSIAHDFKKPFLIAPAMNPAMLKHPATQDNMSKLSGWGYHILPSPDGLMACQEIGSGRMLEADELIEAINYYLCPKVESPKKLILTCGGTSIPIDSVRRITNFSSGKTGFLITKELLRAGHQVTLLRSRGSKIFDSKILFYAYTNQLILREFDTPDELDMELEGVASEVCPDALIQCAAISDFNLANTHLGKVDSKQTLSLALKPREKSLVRFHSKFPSVKIIAFKLTVGAHKSKLKIKLSELFDCPMVVKVIHNTLESVLSSAPNYNVYTSNLKSIFFSNTTNELGRWLGQDLGRQHP